MNLEYRVVNRGSVELIVIGLLAALVVVLACPMLNRLDRSDQPGLPEDMNALPGDKLIID